MGRQINITDKLVNLARYGQLESCYRYPYLAEAKALRSRNRSLPITNRVTNLERAESVKLSELSTNLGLFIRPNANSANVDIKPRGLFAE